MTAMSREEAKGTPEEELWDTPAHWPRNVRFTPAARLAFGDDPRTGELYWDGKPLELKRAVTLEGATFWVAVVAAAATVVAAVWPIIVHFSAAGGNVPTV